MNYHKNDLSVSAACLVLMSFLMYCSYAELADITFWQSGIISIVFSLGVIVLIAKGWLMAVKAVIADYKFHNNRKP